MTQMTQIQKEKYFDRRTGSMHGSDPGPDPVILSSICLGMESASSVDVFLCYLAGPWPAEAWQWRQSGSPPPCVGVNFRGETNSPWQRMQFCTTMARL